MKIKTGVIGTGYLGKFHLQKYNQLQESELVGFSELDESIAKDFCQTYNIKHFKNYQDLLEHVDAVSIVTPTQTHYDIAKTCLSNNIDILLEKPVTQTIPQIEELLKIAKKNNNLIQVGHIERYNPAFIHLKKIMKHPDLIFASRTCEYKKRGTEVSVVFDMMIHDIDLVLSYMNQEIKHIYATGKTVLSDSFDYANATLIFENDQQANIIASRISCENTRMVQAVSKSSSITANLNNKKIHITKNSVNSKNHTQKYIAENAENDAMYEEIKDFLTAVKGRTKPIVSGKAGRDALNIAQKIEACMN